MKRKNLNHGLEPLKNVLNKYGNPQDKIRCIHVAGTNGKGSTCNYLKDILVSKGYKVGMFTSPHLITHRDRIRINDSYISEDVFHHYLLKHFDEIEENHLGMFEIDTLIAFEWFEKEKVDYAIVECGLGGRLDNTNVITHPQLCIITSIGFDHMNLLGNRIQQIAYEKAGIIQPNTTCVIGNVNDEAYNIIQKRAHRVKGKVIPFGRYFPITKNTFCFESDTYEISTNAIYQMHNASLALKSAELLGIDIHHIDVHQTVQNSLWKGRFETICDDPRVIVDGAHNEEGMKALCESMKGLERPIVCVYSALKDKQVHQMAYLLKEHCDHLIVTEFKNERADSAEDLFIDGCEVIKEAENAIHTAMQLCKNGTVVITGSLYFVSFVRSFLKKD